jgi:hypothetical protein
MKRPDLIKNQKMFINSMKVLITRYQEAMKLGIPKSDYESEHNLQCLLCNPLGSKITHRTIERKYDCSFDSACEKLGCPWMVIQGMSCCDYSEKHITYSLFDHFYNMYDEKIMKNRIKQLRRWIEIYKKSLEK